MELDKLFGLPAHPLLVHLPVVLVPLAAIGLVMIALSSGLRHKLGWYVLGLTVVATAGTIFAAGSGEALEERIGESATLEAHAELGDQMRLISLLLLVTVIAVVFLGRRLAPRPAGASVGAAVATPTMNPAIRIGMAVVSIAVATLSTVWIIRTGHAGAKATWEGEGSGQEEQGDESLAPVTSAGPIFFG